MNVCTELAERELNSFYNAVKSLSGREEAERSAREWLAAVSVMTSVPRTVREWREVTVNVATRMALRGAVTAA